ncbi:MAG: hypothetical protein QOK16_3177 [Solirubrobacteraceae bacterium]|nr:hypothetical protein [Solirubrobacteraceae bacterium]
MQGELSVAIVGLGSRGLSVLERIVTLAKRTGAAPDCIRVEVIDPTCAGTGIHTVQQPDYLLLNTVCSQVSMFPEAHSVGTDTDAPGPNLYEWATERGLRVAGDDVTVGREGRHIRREDFLPRRVLGEYLTWFLDGILREAPDAVRVNFHRRNAVDLQSSADGRLTIALDDGAVITTQYVFLTTGHTPNKRANGSAAPRRAIADPYPLPATLEAVAPGQSMAVNGFGLSAMDVIAACTVGRGGQYVRCGEVVRYVPGGAEPQLYLYSHSGIPFRARPYLQRERRPYRPLLLTCDRIDALRLERGGPLDFDADVLPLLLTEMRIAYHRQHAALSGGEDRLVTALTRAAESGALTTYLGELDQEHGAFDAHAAWDRAGAMVLTDSSAYERWVADEIRRDYVQATKGLERSCEKAALEIVRDLRDTVRHAVDFGGLTRDSLESFMRTTVPLMNKAVVGPQKERHRELLALIEAGILQVPFGPAPETTWDAEANRWTISATRLGRPFARPVDWLCMAHVSSPSVSASASPLISRLYVNGWLTRHRPDSSRVHSVDLDTCLHPVSTSGEPDRRLWILGPLCEGTTFYNHAVPSPGGYSRVVADAHRTVAEMLTVLAPEPAAP